MAAPLPLRENGSTPKRRRDSGLFKHRKRSRLPKSRTRRGQGRDLDRFILDAQEKKGLQPVGDADRRTLIRRLTYDLIGLPPTSEEVDAFVHDSSPDALAKTVDRLLASPQFGERWGRHWLDVARFAESTGKERNFTFPAAWRYRDYVIASMNADKPYDEFIREQIAGDLLPAESSAEHDEHVIATGFLALGPKGLNEKNPEQFRVDQIDEQIDATSRGVLGLTVACARCHDHKFDPIPQRDYYALAGIFRSTRTFFGTGGGVGAGKNKNATPLLTLSAPTEPTPLNREPQAPTAPAAKGPIPERRLQRLAARDPQKAAQLRKQLETAGAPAPNGGGGKNAVRSWAVGGNECMGVNDGRAGNATLLIRGEISQAGESIPRGFVNVLNTAPPPAIPGNESGRRELAEWLTSKSNPLTARVEVNRIWLHLFGQGLVRTADNFGTNGEAPSHPGIARHSRGAVHGRGLEREAIDPLHRAQPHLSIEQRHDSRRQ